jgi:hypothetical protein
VLAIDDLQWGDLDSTSLLLDLLRPPDPPAMLLILSFRSEEAEASHAVRQLIAGCRAPGAGLVDVREVEVGALEQGEATDLARSRLGEDGAGGTAALAGAIARESSGDPFLIDQLVRFIHAGGEAERPPSDRTSSDPSRSRPPSDQIEEGWSRRPSGEPRWGSGRPRWGPEGEGGAGRARRSSVADVRFEEVMRMRLGQLGPEARRVLELVAVAGRPLAQRTAARAAEIERDEQAVLVVLRAGSLIRTSGSPEEGRVECYHDRIREAVAASLSEEAQRERHLSLAEALEASDHPDPEALAQHFLVGGQNERGAEYAIEAGEKAAKALAFERAAVFYRLAIESLSREEVLRRRLRVALGDALANAGRGGDAASEYLGAAEGAPAAEALELRRRAAEQLLRCGHLDDGLRALETVLGAVDMHLAPTPRRALWSLISRRLRARLRGLRFVERDPSQVSAERLTRVDICWSVAAGLGLTDTIRGADFQTRHLLLALAAGEPYRISRALAMEAAYSSIGGQPSWRRTEKLLAMAREIANRIDEPHGRGIAAFAEALANYQAGRWRKGFEGFEEAAQVLREQCTGVTFEISSALRFGVDALFNLGELREMCRRVPQYLREAERRGDMYGGTDMRTGLPNAAWLVVDQPDVARAECQRGRECWSQHDFYLQHYYDVLAQAHIDLYLGDGAAAHARVTDVWPKLERSMLLRIQAIRAEALFLRGRTALAAAVVAEGSERSHLIGEAEAARRRLDRQHMPGAHALSNLIGAGAADLTGHPDRALTLLALAESRFQTADMALCAAAARRARGHLLGTPAGARLMQDAERWMASQTIANPPAITRLILGTLTGTRSLARSAG